ncbi:acyl-CoA dehydrogenase family protein [Streptomyces sp. NPDC054904]|uniref:acyl-CoA dehydrogenase family protein n=1 Tax=unclassified Streptomyces TaxID=2593676 RepID=UPI002481F676|nr:MULTISPECIES: acyl-CoA dehydrogenase family protein [unclassified Streptomyces]MDA5283068.1 acyl-CoA dehydrogenase family protein [Streptomyces sp. Isolate_45]MDX2394240.1 acyl-CoA dehydrogenase family protein [Streptomyces sp. DK15]
MELTTSFDPEVLALPFYEDSHRRLAESAGAWCDSNRVLWEEIRTLDPDAAGRRLVRALGAAGWLSELDPRGAPVNDFRAVCLRREALAYAEDLADFAFSIQALAATPLLRFGSEAQRRRYLPGMAAGTLIGAFAVSEKEAGSDVSSVGLEAARAEDGSYLLNGRKAWIANGTIADVFVVIARTGQGPGPLGLSAFLVPADTPGLRVERIDAIAPRSFAHLSFEECRLPADALLGRPGKGFVIAVDLLERFRTTVGAAALGFARRAFDTALAHVLGREAYGATLFDLQLVKASLADMEVQLNAAALLVARAGWETDRGSRRFARHSNIAKVHATEAAQGVVDAAVQLLGAAGIVQGGVTERLYRQVRSLRIYEGTSEVLRMAIAGSLDMRRAARAAA